MKERERAMTLLGTVVLAAVAIAGVATLPSWVRLLLAAVALVAFVVFILLLLLTVPDWVNGIRIWWRGRRMDRASRPSSPAFTGRWGVNGGGVETIGLSNALQKTLMGSAPSPAGLPPSAVRVAVRIATDLLGEVEPSVTELRGRVLAFLGRQWILQLLNELIPLDAEATWTSYGGNGRYCVGAVLTAPDDSTGPRIWAMVNLSDRAFHGQFQDPRYAELIVHVESAVPNSAGKDVLAPVGLQRWCKRLGDFGRLATAFSSFLDELGLSTYDQPPAQYGVLLDGGTSLSEVVDVSGLRIIPGSGSVSRMQSYAVADRAGADPEHAAVAMIRLWCDHGLHVEGYEPLLAGFVE